MEGQVWLKSGRIRGRREGEMHKSLAEWPAGTKAKALGRNVPRVFKALF